MKWSSLFLFSFLFSLTSQACLVFDATRVCAGAIVFPDNWEAQGTLRAINPITHTATVTSFRGDNHDVPIRDISVQLPTYSGIQINETVYPAGWRAAGRVVAFNPHRGTVRVRNVYGRDYILKPCDLGQSGHCVVFVQQR